MGGRFEPFSEKKSHPARHSVGIASAALLEELERSEKSPYAFFHSSTGASVRDPTFPPIFLERQSLPNPDLCFYLSRRVDMGQLAPGAGDTILDT